MVTVTVLIPCFNEEKGIAKVIEALPIGGLIKEGFKVEILVVDNNCTDKTGLIAQKNGARVVKEAKQGKGYALQKGFQEASGEIIVTIDGDNTYPAQEVTKLVEAKRDCDLVIGSRFDPVWKLARLNRPKQLALPRTLANKIGALIGSLILGSMVTDVTTGMRAFGKQLLTEIPAIKAHGLDFEAEFSARVISKGFRYKEVRIGTNQREGQSSLRYFQDAFKFLTAIIRGKYF